VLAALRHVAPTGAWPLLSCSYKHFAPTALAQCFKDQLLELEDHDSSVEFHGAGANHSGARDRASAVA
jgi:hypothetical protein